MKFPNLFLKLSYGKELMFGKSNFLWVLTLDLNTILPYFCGLYSIPKTQVQNLRVYLQNP